jgi:osmotically-inducible protein OsmY
MKILKRVIPLFSILAVASLIGCAASGTHESTGAYVDDSVITTKVKAAILETPNLKSAEINVETYKGVVQLSGFVGTQENINSAVMVAKNVKGVTSVKNDMRLK